MKTVTVKQFKSFRPCWLETAEGREKFARIAAIRNEWTALDVLNLPDVSAQDKLWSVVREEFIEAPILHEFACRCAEYALSFVESPDPRSLASIEAKRKWLRGKITDAELAAASNAAWYAERDAASCAKRAAAWAAAREHEVEILRELLEEGGNQWHTKKQQGYLIRKQQRKRITILLMAMHQSIGLASGITQKARLAKWERKPSASWTRKRSRSL